MRPSVALFVLAALLGSLWLLGYVTVAPPSPPAPTPTAQPVSGTLGSFVVVDRTMFDVLMTAVDQRDPRPFDLAARTGDMLPLDPGTHVRLLKRDGRVAQFEILDGTYAGRAGWQYASELKP